jgi:DNA replication protein DnaC
MFPCLNPDCQVTKRNAEKRFMSLNERRSRQFGSTPENYTHADMSHFEGDYRLAVKCTRLFLQEGAVAGKDTVKRSLVFYGKPGTGKTYLMSAIYNELFQRRAGAIFLKVRTMLKGVQRGYSEDAELRDFEAEDLLRSAPVLFIDELETGLRSGDRTDIFESIIDYRCLNDLPTIIATNLEQEELARVWNHRIQSRLVHMAWWIALDDRTRRDVSPGMNLD